MKNDAFILATWSEVMPKQQIAPNENPNQANEEEHPVHNNKVEVKSSVIQNWHSEQSQHHEWNHKPEVAK